MIIFYITQNIKNDVYNKSKNELQNQVIGRVDSKLLVCATNALSISSDKAIKESLKENNRQKAIVELKDIVKRFKNNTSIKDLKLHIHTKNIDSFVRSWKSWSCVKRNCSYH